MEKDLKTQFLGGTRRISSTRQPDVSGATVLDDLGLG